VDALVCLCASTSVYTIDDVVEPFVTDSPATREVEGSEVRITVNELARATEYISLDGTGYLTLLGKVARGHPGVVSKDAAMLAQIMQRVTAPFRRMRCPECGHKLRETYCDVCGYDLIEQTRDKLLRDKPPRFP
jgi:hypothetical protein